MMKFASTTALFALTAVAEIVGCYLPWLVLKQGRPIWLLLPAAVSLALFAWLLTLHPAAAGRVYAAYDPQLDRRIPARADESVFQAAAWPWRGWRSSTSAHGHLPDTFQVPHSMVLAVSFPCKATNFVRRAIAFAQPMTSAIVKPKRNTRQAIATATCNRISDCYILHRP